jgi:hypothetical protein
LESDDDRIKAALQINNVNVLLNEGVANILKQREKQKEKQSEADDGEDKTKFGSDDDLLRLISVCTSQLKSISSFLTHSSPKIQKFPSLREVIGDEPKVVSVEDEGKKKETKKLFKKNAVKWKRAFSTKPQYAVTVSKNQKRADWMSGNGLLIDSLINANRKQRKVVGIVNVALNKGLKIILFMSIYFLCK